MEAFVWLHQTATLLSQQTDTFVFQSGRWTCRGLPGQLHVQIPKKALSLS